LLVYHTTRSSLKSPLKAKDSYNSSC